MWVDRSFDQSADGAVRTGQTVRHARFGVGQVVEVHPGSPPKVDVVFPGFGKKRIRADYLDMG